MENHAWRIAVCTFLTLSATSVMAQEPAEPDDRRGTMSFAMTMLPEGDSWALGYRSTAWNPPKALGFDYGIALGEGTFTDPGEVVHIMAQLGPMLRLPVGDGAFEPFAGAGWSPSHLRVGGHSSFGLSTFYVKGGSHYFVPNSGLTLLSELGFDFGEGGSALFVRFGLGVTKRGPRPECDGLICIM